MELNLTSFCRREIKCSCGRTHFCDIADIIVGNGVLNRLPDILCEYSHIILVADRNTYAVCGEQVEKLLARKLENIQIYCSGGVLVPNEKAVAELETKITDRSDFILGVGSGVINDICKYTSWKNHLEYGIVGTAPSMDGYASSGAAMIMNDMKITYSTHTPTYIFGEVEVLKQAPIEMIRAGYGDIVGKYSSLNDWKLSALINDEYLCNEIYQLVYQVANQVRDMVGDIICRKDKAIEYLMNALILIGITLSLLGSTRPGSGSEHHLSHYFEITGLLKKKPYLIHGIDVGYSCVITAAMREMIAEMDEPLFLEETQSEREEAWQNIYDGIADEVKSLQKSAGAYEQDLKPQYREKWQQIREIMRECPSSANYESMMKRAGYDFAEFYKVYPVQKVIDGLFYGKDLKNRYSVLWLYYSLFSGSKKIPGIVERAADE